MKKIVKVLSLPACHPYTSKLNSKEIVFVNPNTDLFCQGQCSPKYLDKNYPINTYDLVHIHSSFDRLTLRKFGESPKIFKKYEKTDQMYDDKLGGRITKEECLEKLDKEKKHEEKIIWVSRSTKRQATDSTISV